MFFSSCSFSLNSFCRCASGIFGTRTPMSTPAVTLRCWTVGSCVSAEFEPQPAEALDGRAVPLERCPKALFGGRHHDFEHHVGRGAGCRAVGARRR